MIQLFIENNEIEITEDVQIAITKQFEELSNPTTIINDWSKTVSIPFTEKNNRIFGHIYNIDKLIVAGNSSVGINFNPLLKLDFRIVWNGDVLITGYAKMNEIKQSNGKGTYEITLFGQLGKIFQEMQKITFDTASDTTDYIIDGSEYVSEEINRSLVYDSWTSPGQTHEELLKVNDNGYSVTDIIGFAPNNSFSDGFDYKTYQIDASASKKFEETLGDSFAEDTGIDPSTAIPDGMLPREIGEYRSYYQLPFIYWNKLFKIFQNKAESVTGYTFDLDEGWFNNLNPYWYNLVYMLKPLDIKRGESYENSYYLSRLSSDWTPARDPDYSATHTYSLSVYQTNYENQPILSGNNTFNLLDGSNYTVFKFNYRLDLETYLTQRTALKADNALLVDIVATGSNGTVKRSHYLFTDDLSRSYVGTDGYTKIKLEPTVQEVSQKDILRAYFTGYHVLDRTEMGDSVTFKLEYKWYKNSFPYANSYDVEEITIDMLTTNTNAVIMYDSLHSGGNFILNDLWNKDYNPFGEILKYCKMFRIGISVDEFEKKIYFKPFTKYFSTYSIEDWTDKIDKSKDFTIKPITFENKYVLFNYEDNKTNSGAEYKEKYGVNYGEYRLITDYNFNNETTELFDKVKSSIVNTDNVLSWTNLYNYRNISYSFPAEIFVYNKDKDNKQVDIFGSFYFHNGLANFSTEAALRMRPVSISDDTPLQLANNTYFYAQLSGYITGVTTYPKLDIVNGDRLCVFNAPKENYTYLNNYSEKSTIYSSFWENYLNERYNIQNKLITCYVDIRPQDYKAFDFNKFVKIGNQLCMVNKIYDYDITNDQTTKVDLVTIQNVSGYADDTFMRELDELTLSWSSMVYINGTEGASATLGTFTSLSDVTFDDDTKSKTINGIQFYINDYNNTINAYNTEGYVDEEDLEFTVVLKNKYWTAEFDVTRYSVYPYPYISITDGNGNEVTELTGGSYTLHWECTETDTLDNVPTVSISTTGRGVRVLPSGNWTVEEKMYQDGEDEYFRNMYSEVISVSKILNGTATFTITDKQGWHQTKTYNVV